MILLSRDVTYAYLTTSISKWFLVAYLYKTEDRKSWLLWRKQTKRWIHSMKVKTQMKATF